MNRKGSMLLRPGTIFLFVLIAALGIGMYSWAETTIGQTRKDSIDNQNNAIGCSTLEISKADIQISRNQTKLFFEVNKDVEKVKLDFEGEKSVSKTVEPVEKSKIETVAVNISNFSSVSAETPKCNRVFRFK
jgi:hypothetical protein